MRFFLKKKYKSVFDEYEVYFNSDKPFYVFGEIAVRGGDYYYGESHERTMNTLALHLFGDASKRVICSGKDLNKDEKSL